MRKKYLWKKIELEVQKQFQHTSLEALSYYSIDNNGEKMLAKYISDFGKIMHLFELEDIAQIPQLSKEDLIDQKHALREFENLFRSLVLEVLSEKK